MVRASRLWGGFGFFACVVAGGVLFLIGCDGATPTATTTPAVPRSTTTALPNLSVTATLTVDAIPTDDEGTVEVTTATPVPSPVGLDEDARTGVYASVIFEMLDKEGKEVSHVYISPYIGQGEHLDNPDEDTPLPEQLLTALKRFDEAGNRTYETRDFADVVGSFDDGGKVKEGGVFITLGPIENDAGKSDEVTVRGSIYREVVSAEGNIYSLSRDSSSATGWKVVTTAPEWSSDGQ